MPAAEGIEPIAIRLGAERLAAELCACACHSTLVKLFISFNYVGAVVAEGAALTWKSATGQSALLYTIFATSLFLAV